MYSTKCSLVAILSLLMLHSCCVSATLLKFLLKKKLFAATHEPLPYNEEQFMPTPDIIRNRGYPVEIHYVTTSDGYILQLHRIPYGRTARRSRISRTPVFLQHGLLDSSSTWVISPTERGLAYLLADRGYDVWLGNIRGNTYSRNHTTLDPNDQAFWSFSYDHMGKFDIPACIDYVLRQTGRDRLTYIGHSMGTTVFWVAMSSFPELNAKIEVMIGLGPAASTSNIKSPIRFFSPYVDKILNYLRLKQTRVFLPHDGLTRKLQDLLCSSYYSKARFCQNAIFLLTGSNPNGFNTTMIPIINGHNPAGTSIYTVAQYAQGHNIKPQKFLHYDWGSSMNLLFYNQTTPPEYNLKQVTAPVYLFWGQNDLLTVPEDVAWLASRLGNLKASFRVEWDQFNHMDFLWASNAKELLYNQLITLLPSPS